jgi:hypothetical protein
MHPAALENFKREWALALPEIYQHPFRVLDMGGQDINGTVHGHIRADVGESLELHVLDIEAGAGVTHVGDARDTSWWDGQPYDVVISTEMLEHLENWQHSVDVAHRVLRSGGWFIGTCASNGRQEHGATGAPMPAPDEWYRNVDPGTFVNNVKAYGFDRINVGYEMNGAPTTHDLHWRARKAG